MAIIAGTRLEGFPVQLVNATPSEREALITADVYERTRLSSS